MNMSKKIPEDVLQNLKNPERYPDEIVELTDRDEIIGRRYVKSERFHSQTVPAFWTADIGQTGEFCGVIAVITGKTIKRSGTERHVFVTVDFYDKV